MQFSFLSHPLEALTLVTSALFKFNHEDHGFIACANLTQQLGRTKVITRKFSMIYVTTVLDYWNMRNSASRPSCVVLPTTTSDVATAIKSITAARSRFAIKAGGHNPNKFFSSVDEGVLISLAKLNAKSYNSKNSLATYGPGSTFKQVYEYFAPYNVTVVGARLAGVGTGLALGGGLSYLSSQYGLAADNFRELEVVLPSGDVVTASSTQNSDLFLGLKGGGGNQYGVVTRYTVQARPIGVFTAGNLIYYSRQTLQVIEAFRYFTLYNNDPKAAIIAAYQRLPVPGLDLNLSEACLLFLVYDGPDAGQSFDNFTKIPHLINTLKTGRTYLDVVNLPVPGASKIPPGNNFFRNSVHRIDDHSLKTSLENWRTWASSNKADYLLTSIDFQPVPKSLTDASKAQGGNALNLPDGPWYWLNFLINSPPFKGEEAYVDSQKRFKEMVDRIPRATDLPLFPNDCAYDQDPLETFTTYKELQATKKKYDPTGYFTNYTGGWSFDPPS